MCIFDEILASVIKKQIRKAYTPEQIEEKKDQNISDFQRALKDAGFRSIQNLTSLSEIELHAKIKELVDSVDLSADNEEEKKSFSGELTADIIAIYIEAIRRRNKEEIEADDYESICEEFERYKNLTDIDGTDFNHFFSNLGKSEKNKEIRRIR